MLKDTEVEKEIEKAMGVVVGEFGNVSCIILAWKPPSWGLLHLQGDQTSQS